MDPATRERLDSLEKRVDRHESVCLWQRNLTWLTMIGLIGYLFKRTMGW